MAFKKNVLSKLCERSSLLWPKKGAKKMLRKVSIIGGSGFVGTNLCKLLVDKSIAFEILDIKPSRRYAKNYKFADVTDLNSLRKNLTGSVVINLAAVHRDDIIDKERYYLTNVLGTKNVAEIAREKKIKKIIFISSSAVYGLSNKSSNEDTVPNPNTEYGKTKLAAEKVLTHWQKNNKGCVLGIIRSTVIFGEGNRGNVYNLLKSIASGKFIMVGNGKNKKSLAYIENIVPFIFHILSKNFTGKILCNYVDKPDLDMNSLTMYVGKRLKKGEYSQFHLPKWLGLAFGYSVDIISVLLRKKLFISSERIKKFCANTIIESCRENDLSFQRPYTLKEGLNKTLKSEFISPKSDREIFYAE